MNDSPYDPDDADYGPVCPQCGETPEWEDCHMCDGVGHYGGLDCPLCAGAGGWHYCAVCYEIEMRAEQDEHDLA